jgi:L-histidine N-alpha-methyltransferase
MAAEVRRALGRRPPELPSKYFYDERGMRLFERITALPEYYLTRSEHAILEENARAIVRSVRPSEVVEIGSGTSPKLRMILDAMAAEGLLRRCVLLDISAEALRSSTAALEARYPGLETRAVVGDFQGPLDALGPGGGRLVCFLGSTIGNLHPREVPAFLARVRAQLAPGDAFLLGVDLVKDTARLEAAYNDTAGVTAEFNRNLLRVLNRRLGATFEVDAFEHVAFYDEERAWIEMRLRASRHTVADLGDARLVLTFDAGDEVRTEISCKYTRASLDAVLAGTGLRVEGWHAGTEGLFALALMRPAP